MVEPWLLPRPDTEGEEDEESEGGEDESDDDDNEAGVPWAGEGYQRSVDAPPATLYLGVLPDNQVIVKVFQRCRIDVSIGMGAYWQGISAAEVRAACVLSRVSPREWPRVTDGVQLMGRVVADIRNDAEAGKGKHKR